MNMNTDTRYIVGLTNIEPTYTINHTIGNTQKQGERGKDKKRRANCTCRNCKKWGGVLWNSDLLCKGGSGRGEYQWFTNEGKPLE